MNNWTVERDSTFEAFDEDGMQLSVSFTRITEFGRDKNSGSDIDGHRGEDAIYIEDDRVTDIYVNGYKLDAAPIPESSRYFILYELKKWLKENEPDEE